MQVLSPSSIEPRRIYISGPMSGLPELNLPAFAAEEARIKASGHVALSPAWLPDGLTQAQYMDVCLALVRAASEMVMLPGWERSAGARAERAYAEKLGLPIVEKSC